MRLLIVLTFFILHSILVFGQNKQFMFSNYDKSDGLSNNRVLTFFKDTKGFIWIGTIEGLSRFDGYAFKVYKNNPKDKTSIKDNFVTKIFEDNDGKLWISSGEYFNIFDPRTETFSQKQTLFNGRINIPRASYGFPLYDNDRNIIYGNSQLGIFKYFTKNDSLIKIDFPNPDNSGIISWMDIDRKGNLLVASTNARLYFLSGKDYSVKDSIQLSKSTINRYFFFIDSDNDVWLYDERNSSGLFYYNLKDKKLLHFTNKSKTCRLNNNTISGIVQDDKGMIWVTTDHGGVNIINKNNFTVSYVLNDPVNNRSICDNNLTTIYKDYQGFIWIGSYRRGFSYFHENLFNFDYYKFNIVDYLRPEFNDIGDFAEDKKGNLWISSNGGGLFYLDAKKNTLKRYVNNPNDSSSISTDILISLYLDKKERLWIGTYFGGLNLFNGNKFEHFKNDPNNPSTISDDRIWDICEDSDGYLWIAAHHGGVNVFDPENKKVVAVYKGFNSSLKATATFTVFAGTDDIIWIATVDGLRAYNKKTNKFEYFNHDENNPNTISNNFTYDVFEDSRGYIWIGTTDGLNLYNKKTKIFKVFREEDGLLSNIIITIREDNNNTLWLGTSNGLSNLVISKDKSTGKLKYNFKNFDVSNGLQGEEFNEHAALKTSNGMLFFGGSNGFNSFYPDKINAHNINSEIVFTDFQIFNRSISNKTVLNKRYVLNNSITFTGTIKLKHNEDVITIEFSDLNFILPDKRIYKYKLDNFNDEWFTTNSNNRKITYTNLDPGQYVFRVKSTNNDGTWNNKEARLEIIVLTPWYGTLFFKILFIIVLLSIIVLIYIYRIYNLNRQKKLLAQMVARRTQQLTNLNTVLEERQKEIVNKNLELERHQNQLEELVYERTIKLEEAMNQAKESDRLKSAFLANMSHEIRTPMNAIVGFANLLDNSDLSNEDRLNMIQLINSNSESLIMLIDDILDLSMIEANQLLINKKPFYINELANVLISNFKINNPNPKVEIKYNNPLEVLNLKLNTDQYRLKQIITNLFDNACKFTNDGYIEFGIKQENEDLCLYIEDTGIGIAKDDVVHLFERFRKVGHNEKSIMKGVGLGLAISKKISELLGGQLFVRSELGIGTVFSFCVPANEIITDKAIEQQDKSVVSENIWENKSILIVEDEELNYIYIKKILERTKVKIVWAENGIEALNRFNQGHIFDVVLMDIKMPKMDGNEAFKKLKDLYPNQIIIAQTAYARPEDRKKLLESGFDNYIAKPIKPDEMIQLLVKYM